MFSKFKKPSTFIFSSFYKQYNKNTINYFDRRNINNGEKKIESVDAIKFDTIKFDDSTINNKKIEVISNGLSDTKEKKKDSECSKCLNYTNNDNVIITDKKGAIDIIIELWKKINYDSIAETLMAINFIASILYIIYSIHSDLDTNLFEIYLLGFLGFIFGTLLCVIWPFILLIVLPTAYRKYMRNKSQKKLK